MARHYPDTAEIARNDALYDAGELGSRELMQWDMDVLPHDAELLAAEAAAMPQDEAFPAFVAAVRERGAHVEVVSDGFGFYVDRTSPRSAWTTSSSRPTRTASARRRGHVLPVWPPGMLRVRHMQARACPAAPGAGSGRGVHR